MKMLREANYFLLYCVIYEVNGIKNNNNKLFLVLNRKYILFNDRYLYIISIPKLPLQLYFNFSWRKKSNYFLMIVISLELV